MNGWFQCHRQLVESQVFADADLLRLWIWLLARTSFRRTHVPMKVGRGTTLVTLEPGQCIVGRLAASSELKWPPSTFRDRLQKLQTMGMIDRQPDTHWTIVSIVNWDAYQHVEDETTTGNPTPKRQATTNQATQIKNANKAKKKNSDPKSKKPTVDEVRAYCAERKNQIDAEYFVDYYTANGWTQGKNKPIRDWKAAIRTWERNSRCNDNGSKEAATIRSPAPTLNQLANETVTPRGGHCERS